MRLMVLVGTSGLSTESRAKDYSRSGRFPDYIFSSILPKVSRLARANYRCQFSWRNGSVVLSSRGAFWPGSEDGSVERVVRDGAGAVRWTSAIGPYLCSWLVIVRATVPNPTAEGRSPEEWVEVAGVA